MMVVICCYPGSENEKVCNFRLNNSAYFKLGPPSNKGPPFKRCPLISTTT